MAVTKKIQIQNASGTGYDSRDIGAEAQYVVVSRDSSGDIIEDITASGVVVDTTEDLSATLKNLEDDKQDTLTFDTTPTQNSTNPVTSGGIYTAIQADSAMSASSTKPVQNRVITAALNKKIDTYTETPASWDTAPTQNSTKPITSGGVYDALQGVGANDNFIGTVAEWNALTTAEKEQYKTIDFTDDFNGAGIDAVPTQNSTNAVQSGGVYTALQGKEDAAVVLTDTLTVGSTTLTFNDASITTSSVIDIYADLYGIAPTSVVVTTGQAVLTFEAQAVAVSVKLYVR